MWHSQFTLSLLGLSLSNGSKGPLGYEALAKQARLCLLRRGDYSTIGARGKAAVMRLWAGGQLLPYGTEAAEKSSGGLRYATREGCAAARNVLATTERCR